MQREGDTVWVPIHDETLRNFTDASDTVYDDQRTVSETAICQRSPAQRLVSQNLHLTGTCQHAKSRIIIGGQLTGSMNPIDAFGNRVIKEQRSTPFIDTNWISGDCFGITPFKRI